MIEQHIRKKCISFVGGLKLRKRVRHKISEYYQQVLWGEVGTYLEHILLWWGNCPLGHQSPQTGHHFRTWLNNFIVSGKILDCKLHLAYIVNVNRKLFLKF